MYTLVCVYVSFSLVREGVREEGMVVRERGGGSSLLHNTAVHTTALQTTEPVVIVAIWRINREVVHGQSTVNG